MKRSIIAIALSSLLFAQDSNAAQIQFASGNANNQIQAQNFLQQKLERDYAFSYLRKGNYGIYYGFQPKVQDKPIFNLVDSIAVTHAGEVFRYYQSVLSQNVVEQVWPTEQPERDDTKLLKAMEKQSAHLTIDSVNLGWWFNEGVLVPVWNVQITETLQDQGVKSHYFIDLAMSKVVGQRGYIEPYRSEVDNKLSGYSAQTWLFNPDPKTSLMSEDLEKTFDSETTLPDSAFRLVELQDLTLSGEELILSGPYAQVIDFAEPQDEVKPLKQGEVQKPHHSSAEFLQQMAYFHVDSAQRHLQYLGFNEDKLVHYSPITVDAQGSVNDQSAYSFYQKRILLGIGGTPDGQDADVIWHEYGHSITNFINPYDDGADSGAIGEGFSDFFAGSHSYRDPQGYEFEPNLMFNWDARFGVRRPRTMNDEKARYNPNYYYPAHVHVAGDLGDQLWATPLFQSFRQAETLYGVVGMDDIERIVIEAMYGLGAGVTMDKLALSTLDMAKRMYPEKQYAQILQSEFAKHNLLPRFLQLEQKSALELTSGDVEVTYSLTNLSHMNLDNIKVAAHTGSDISLQATEHETLQAGKSVDLKFNMSLAKTFDCGDSVVLPINVSFDNGLSVLDSETNSVNLQIGKADVIKANGEGGVLKDATGEASGVVTGKGVTNFYLNLDSGDTLIDKNFKLHLDLSHHDLTQLSVSLLSPSGKKVEVWQQAYYPHGDFNFTLPSQVSQVDFSEFYGQKFTGEWQLQIVDHRPDFDNSLAPTMLISWQLSQIKSYQCSVVEESNESDNSNASSNQTGNNSETDTATTSQSSGGGLFWMFGLLIVANVKRLKLYTQEKS